jgi:hypothetical protein
MKQLRRLIALSAFCLPLGMGHASAQDPLPPLEPFNHSGYYSVSWSGIGVGGMAMETAEDANSYRMNVEVKSGGIAWALTKHENITSVHGLKRDGEYLPQQFETVFKLRGKTRHIVLTYNDKGELVDEVNTPPEPEWKRPPVPMELKKHVVDALTPFFQHRTRIYEAIRAGEDKFTIRMFDGRRLTDMHYFIQGRRALSWNRQNVKVFELVMTRSPVAGYKDSELEDIANEQDPDVSLYLSDDGKLIPLKIEVDSDAGRFYANYKRACASFADCKAMLD